MNYLGKMDPLISDSRLVFGCDPKALPQRLDRALLSFCFRVIHDIAIAMTEEDSKKLYVAALTQEAKESNIKEYFSTSSSSGRSTAST